MYCETAIIFKTSVPTVVSKRVFCHFLYNSPITKHLQVYRQNLKCAPWTSGSKKIFSAKKPVNCATSTEFLGEMQA